MTKIVDQNPVSHSFARRLLGRSAVGTIAAALMLPMASVVLLAGASVPAYAQAAGNCLTADDEETIKAMQALIASLDAEIADLQSQKTSAEAEVTQVKADIDALDEMFRNGVPVPNGAQKVTDLNNKLVDANRKVAQIDGQISNDQGHKARAEGVLKALLAKKPCVPPAITAIPPVNPPAIVVNRTFDPPAIVVNQPVEPSTWWRLVDRIRFNDDGTETWRWKDGHETVRTRTGVTSELPTDKIKVAPPVTHTALPETSTDKIKVAPPVTHTALSETSTEKTKVALPVTHTALSETTPRTLGTTTTHTRLESHPLQVADHATTSIGHSTFSSLARTGTMHATLANMRPMPSMGGGMSHFGGMGMGMSRMGGFGKLR